MAVVAVSTDFAFRSLLIDQAKLNLAETANQIAHDAQAEATFGFGGARRLELVLSRRTTLDHWAAGNEFVQIDTVAGQILGKSTNLGGFTFPAWRPHGADHEYADLGVGGDRSGTMLVLNRVLLDDAGRPIVVIHVGQRLDIADELIARAGTLLIGIT